LALAAASALSLGATGQASASGGPIVSQGGTVFVNFIGTSAILRSELWFFGVTDQSPTQTPDLTNAVYLFDNHGNGAGGTDHNSTAPGAVGTPQIGSPTGNIGNLAGGAFTPGSSLIFGLFVQDLYNVGFTNPQAPGSRGAWFYSDPGTNFDGRFHTVITQNATTGDYTVGFEDLCKDPKNAAAIDCTNTRYTFDGDFNDHMFMVSQNPEPVSMALLGTGLFGLAGVSLRRRKNGMTQA
jgi:hypothetical protein